MSHAIEIRDVESIREIRNVEELQKRTWGEADRDIVPLNQLVAARDVGGTLIGAFDGDRLVGSFTGSTASSTGSVHPLTCSRSIGSTAKAASANA